MITREMYLMGREIEYPTMEEVEVNIARLLFRVNALLRHLGMAGQVSSGYRPGHYNKAAGGAAKSAHLTGEAIDLADLNGDLKKLIVTQPKVLETFDLHMEAPSKTPTWCHLQTRPTKTGNRIFIP